MRIVPFQCERLMSRWQNEVAFDLSPSGVAALTFEELVTPEELREVYETTQLRYIQTNGTKELKEAICRLYAGCEPENILVSNGSTEGGFVVAWHLVERGDEVVVVVPNYMQFAGLAEVFGARIVTCKLDEDRAWALDLDELQRVVTPRTKAIYVSNPNNPTGAILGDAERSALVAAAERVGAWLISDEVYRGAELVGDVTATMWGGYERLIAVGSLSKAYALPGLRIGWIVAPADLIDTIWAYHDYTTITATALGDRLARLALQPEKMSSIRKRNRAISLASLRVLEDWVASNSNDFEFVPPRIGGVAFLRYGLDMPSEELVERILRDRSVLTVPGGAFGLEGYLRIGYGAKGLKEGLGEVAAAYATIAASS